MVHTTQKKVDFGEVCFCFDTLHSLSMYIRSKTWYGENAKKTKVNRKIEYIYIYISSIQNPFGS